MPDIAENQVIDGRYRVLHRVGSGGMADVWCAEDTSLGRRVALKVLHHRFAQDREFVARFRREAEAAAGLQHPNVVGVFDRGDVDGTYYIAMEYLDGRSLKEMIDAGLTPPEAVGLIRQVLEAARFAHRHGIVHRDFKPQNVIVDADGHVTVTDFGIARAGVSEITQTGSVMGTAHYLSPEQAQGREVTAASDLYSIGVMLYEALTGQVPFHGESAVAIALKQVSQTPRRPSALNPDIPPALDAVVMRALEKDPERRFQDADAFLSALEAAERDPGAPVGEDTAAYALPPVVAAEPAAAAPGAPPPPWAERDDEEDRRRRRRWILVAVAILLGALAGWALSRDTTTEVPNVTNPFGTNIELAEALGTLEDEGFEVADVNRVRRDLPRDTVIEQDPPPGSASLDCAVISFFCSKPAVTLTVSAGPGRAEVPDVVGEEREVAERRLRRAGFGVAAETRFDPAIPAGLVLATDPPAGEVVRRTSRVTMIVSSGPRQVVVPGVVGDQRAAAVAEVRERGLEASVSEQEDDAPAGQVIDQSPEAGAEVDENSVVSLVVSTGPSEVTVPNVIGQLRPQAVSALRSRGLTVEVVEQPTDVQAQNNRVVDQFPQPGAEAEEGDTVTIRVGDYQPPSQPQQQPPQQPPQEGAPAPPRERARP